MRRVFLVKASRAVTAPTFTLRSLASASGRMDVIARSVVAAFSALRPEMVTFEAVLEGPPNPPLTIRFEGASIPRFPRSEGEAGAMILDALSGRPPPGVTVVRRGFRRVVLDHASEGHYLIYMHEAGEDIRPLLPALVRRGSVVFILGDHLGLDPDSESFLDGLGIPRVSLGPTPYFTSHCIAIVNEELDRAEGGWLGQFDR